MTGRIIHMQWIDRDYVRAHPNTYFVFGDNMARKGLGGQAKACRGESNAIGIPTKWFPDMGKDAFFCDRDFQNPDVQRRIGAALKEIQDRLDEGRNVVIPADGIGTGLANLPERAPAIYKFIKNALDQMETDQWPMI